MNSVTQQTVQAYHRARFAVFLQVVTSVDMISELYGHPIMAAAQD